MPAADHSTHDLLRRYLSGEITAPEEAELERRARQDETLEAAMRGLRAFPEEDHPARVRRMLAWAGQQQTPAAGAAAPVRRINWRRWSVAASLLLLLAVAAFLLPRAFNAPEDAMAMEADPAPEEEVVPESVAKTEERDDTPTALPGDPAPLPPTRDPRPVATKESPTKTEVPAPAETPSASPDDASTVSTPPAPPPPPPAPAEEVMADVGETEPEVTDQSPADPIPPPPAAEAAAAEPVATAAGRSRRVDPESFRAQQAGRLLRGRITTVNGSPVAGALVRIPGLPLGERSDSNGVFQMQIDETISLLQISHPDYEAEAVEVPDAGQAIQVSLSPEERVSGHEWALDAAKTRIEIDQSPGYARPEEGYGNLRNRIETNRPEGIPAGKVKFSFLVNLDGSLTDFRFRGRPDSLTMDYVGRTLVETSSWNVVKGEEPVRVHFKLRFE